MDSLYVNYYSKCSWFWSYKQRTKLITVSYAPINLTAEMKIPHDFGGKWLIIHALAIYKVK